MASPRGFEPPASGLGNRCSILLSYGDVTADGDERTFECLLRGVERTGVLEDACNGQIRPRPVEARAMETDMATMYWQ